jgi:hypothetical protein
MYISELIYQYIENENLQKLRSITQEEHGWKRKVVHKYWPVVGKLEVKDNLVDLGLDERIKLK